MSACFECGREKPPAKVPAHASVELKLALEASARVCLWCHDLNLLAGGWEDARLTERWTPDELIEMREKARKVQEDRLLDQWQRRSARLHKKEEAQGAFV